MSVSRLALLARALFSGKGAIVGVEIQTLPTGQESILPKPVFYVELPSQGVVLIEVVEVRQTSQVFEFDRAQYYPVGLELTNQQIPGRARRLFIVREIAPRANDIW